MPLGTLMTLTTRSHDSLKCYAIYAINDTIHDINNINSEINDINDIINHTIILDGLMSEGLNYLNPI